MSHRIRPLLTALAVTATVAGGGAAIASAATSSTSSSAKTPPAAASHAPMGHAKAGGKNCPNM